MKWHNLCDSMEKQAMSPHCHFTHIKLEAGHQYVAVGSAASCITVVWHACQSLKKPHVT